MYVCMYAPHLHERGEMLRLTAVTRHTRVHLDHHRGAWKLPGEKKRKKKKRKKYICPVSKAAELLNLKLFSVNS